MSRNVLLVGVGTSLDVALAAAHAPIPPAIVCQPPAEDVELVVLPSAAQVIENFVSGTRNCTYDLLEEIPNKRKPRFAHGWNKDK